mmetsp:Transcript_119654/g.343715  ORF Transcript_119654/g.343715 Transcript_119654/m.343715 type:complete len:353 (+) Transcript_119654:1124-2182(+)
MLPQHGTVRQARVSQVLGNASVGQQHELLDDPMGRRVGFQVVARWNAILALAGVEDHFDLRDRERPARESGSAHLAAHIVQEEDVLLDFLPSVPAVHRRRLNRLAVQHLLHLVVIQTADGADRRLPEPRLRVLDELAGRELQPEERRKRQLGLVRVQGAEVVAQGMRKHRQHPVEQIHGGRPELGLGVRQRAGLDEVRDVGDVHADLHLLARLVQVNVDRVVEVPGRGGVDGEDPLVPQVHAAADLLVEVPLGNPDDVVDLRQQILLEVHVVAVQLVFDQGVPLLGVEISRFAQALPLQTTDRQRRRPFPADHLDGPQLVLVQLPRDVQHLPRDVVDLDQDPRHALVCGLGL